MAHRCTMVIAGVRHPWIAFGAVMANLRIEPRVCSPQEQAYPVLAHALFLRGDPRRAVPAGQGHDFGRANGSPA
jgi:hypothetical protein